MSAGRLRGESATDSTKSKAKRLGFTVQEHRRDDECGDSDGTRAPGRGRAGERCNCEWQ